MFGLLKNKISSFIDSLTKREEEKIEEAAPAPSEKPVERKPEPVKQVEAPKPVEKRPEPKIEVPKPAPKPVEVPKPIEKKPVPKPVESPKPAIAPAPRPVETPTQVTKPAPRPVEVPKPAAKLVSKPIEPPKPATTPAQRPIEISKPAAKPVQKPLMFPAPAEKKPEEKMKVSLSLESKVRGLFLGEVEMKEKDIDDLLQELEIALLEADVAFEVSQHLVEDLKRKLVGKRVKRGDIQRAIKDAVAASLRETMDLRGPDLMKLADEKNAEGEPLKILFVGPNGAGKTTTMAKIADKFMKAGKTVLFSASDSYRAAAIEQTEEHAKRLGIRAIKHKYGADPAAICFDAVSHAKANKINVVLMDTAGRQETNRNLIDEMKKIARVASPDLKIFVGESIAGNALVDQVRAFKEAVGLDGVILTKLDCDAKGGTALSVARASGVPILFFGIGQGYGDLVPFDPDLVIKQVFD